MRIFQNSGLYPGYLPRLRQLTRDCKGYKAHVNAFLEDRFGASHFLEPILDRQATAFFTNGDDEFVQRIWAAENGLASNASLETILLAQIETHRTEVFYNMDPLRFGSDFVRKLPGCVRSSVAWRAAPSPGADFGAYDFVVCNFPSILESYRRAGWNPAYFAPAHDPVMDSYAANKNRPVDITFVGGYSRHHRRRAELLEKVAALREKFSIVMHLDRSRITRLAESPVGRILPMGSHRRPAAIRQVSYAPIFGLELYWALSRSKVIVNGAVDMAGHDRGNMRCFEAMGCGALLLSDHGNYPAGMVADKTMVTYTNPENAISALTALLARPDTIAELAHAGHELVKTEYSKAHQWRLFQNMVGGSETSITALPGAAPKAPMAAG